jgi:hypothetical protein
VLVAAQMPPRILVAALTTLLADALGAEETRHLIDDRFLADLSALRARVEAELDALAGERRLRLAEPPDTSVPDD